MLPAYAPYQPADPEPNFANAGQRTSSMRRLRGLIASTPGEPRATKPKLSLKPVWRGRVLLTLNQLSVMSQNGIEIADALESVARNCRDGRLARSLQAIHDAVNAGQSLSIAVQAHGIYFPPTLAPMLAAAEASGDVPETLGRVCRRMRSELQTRGTIMGAMIYPVILIGASSVVNVAFDPRRPAPVQQSVRVDGQTDSHLYPIAVVLG